MKRIAVPLALLVTGLGCALLAAPAQAQNRTYTAVSATGPVGLPGAGSCTVESPCRTLQAAFNVTAENGVIDVLDPGEYGPLTITHAVSIEGHGWATVTQGTVGGTAISISAGTSDRIDIRGVVLDGLGNAANGISFTAGASLNVQDSVMRNFRSNTSSGIYFAPTASSQLSVSNTLLSDNAFGINISLNGSGTVAGALDHVEMENNLIIGLFASTSAPTINLTVSDSVSANNGQNGIESSSSGGTANVMVQNSKIANNSVGSGLLANGAGATIWVTHSSVTGNGTGWSTQNSGNLVSYSDNSNVNNTNASVTSSTIGYQ